MPPNETGTKAAGAKGQLRLEAPKPEPEPAPEPEPTPAPVLAQRPVCTEQKDGESLYGFKLREAAFNRAVDLWIDAWVASGAMMSRAARHLGIAPNNVPQIWKRLGLTAELLSKLAFGKDS